jgi:hypothetical protein
MHFRKEKDIEEALRIAEPYRSASSALSTSSEKTKN